MKSGEGTVMSTSRNTHISAAHLEIVWASVRSFQEPRLVFDAQRLARPFRRHLGHISAGIDMDGLARQIFGLNNHPCRWPKFFSTPHAP